MTGSPTTAHQSDAFAEEIEQLRGVLNSLTEMIYVLDEQYIYRFMNVAYANWFGIDPKRAIGQHVSDIHGDSAFARLKPYFDQALHGTQVKVEMRLPSKTGVQRFGRGIYSPKRNAHGKVIGLVASVAGIEDKDRPDSDGTYTPRTLGLMGDPSSEGLLRFELTPPLSLEADVETQMREIIQNAYVIECNDVLMEMYALAADDVIGMKLERFLPAGPGRDAFLSNFIKNGYRNFHVESIEPNRRGKQAYFSRSLVGLKEKQHLIGGWATQKDQTDAVNSRESLRRSEERLRMASDAGNVGIWEWDVVSGQLYWSDRVKLIYGFPLDFEPSMDEYRARIHPEDAEATRRNIEEALQRFPYKPYETIHRILVGEKVKWVQGQGKVVLDGSGQAIRMMGTVVDITAQKEAEAKAVQLREFGLNLSKVRTTEDLVAIITEFGSAILGAQATAVYERKDSIVRLIGSRGYPESTLAYIGQLSSGIKLPFADAAFNGRAIFLESHEDIVRQYPHLSAKGVTRHAMCGIPMHIDDRVIGLIGMSYDSERSYTPDMRRFILTFADQCAQTLERVQLSEKEKASRLEAESANLAKSVFLANMSHEIRTPLGAILGFAEFAKDPNLDPTERDEFLSIIIRNGRLLNTVINDILDLSKIEADRLEIEIIAFDLRKMLADILMLMQLQARDKGLTLGLSIADKVPDVIHSDPTRLKQILINLVGNALKFTLVGGVQVSVTHLPEKAPHRVHLQFEVADTGTGIAPDHVDRLFKPFMQADSSTTRKYGGTGLGLVISKRLARALGGDLRLHATEPGKGSRFLFTIDAGMSASTPMDDAAALTAPSEAKIKKAKELAGLKILLVDDGPDNRLLITRILKSQGASVESAENGRDGVDQALAGTHDLVLMDIQMPAMDGFTALRFLQGKGYAKPVLALTAHAMKGDRERILSAGFVEHLVKPIDRGLLIQTIKRQIR